MPRSSSTLSSPFVRALLALSIAGASQAQVIAVFLKDEKAAEKYEDRVVKINGRLAVLGEMRVGLTLDGNSFRRDPKVSPELWVADPDQPELPAYELDRKGKLKAGSKDTILRMDWSQIADEDFAAIVMKDESLPSLSREYVLRREQIDAFRAERDAEDRTTAAWAAMHVRYVTALEGLQMWLSNTLWPDYAKKLEKEITKESKAHKGLAVRARHDKAMASLQTIDVPEKLLALSESISGGEDTFHARETQHFRFMFVDEVESAVVEEALLIGEEILEGFRTRLVDPYLADDFEDRIPDDVFQEFLITPAENETYAEYTKGLYGVDWTKDREKRLASGGGRIDGNKSTRYKSFWKYKEDLDVPGIVCHQLGHALAGLHYGQGGSIEQDWLGEALGYYLSFEFLGRNSVTCKQFGEDPKGYVKPDRKLKEGEKTAGEGRRDLYNKIALELGRPIEQVALRKLFELDDSDLAKAWSFYDYLARAEKKPGQLWLRAAGKHAQTSPTFLADWREEAAEILGVDPGEAFKAMDARWRAFAEAKGDEED